MKFLGAWLLSFFFWLIIALIVTYRFEEEVGRDRAVEYGKDTLIIGFFLTGLAMMGIWCIWFS